MKENNFKIGDKVKIRTNVTLEEIKANSFKGCQYDTMKFLLNESGADKQNFGRVFVIEKVLYNGCVKVKNINVILNDVIFEKIEVKEMTIDEISKKLGYEVKIVKEEN